MNRYETHAVFIDAALKEGIGAGDPINRASMREISKKHNLAMPYWITDAAEKHKDRGFFHMPAEPCVDSDDKLVKRGDSVAKAAPVATPASTTAPVHITNNVVEPAPGPIADVEIIINAVPKKFPNYVEFGFFKDIVKIMKSGTFLPALIAGLSGNGKTLMVEQAAAKCGRECFRVPITVETDEDTLLGGMRLKDGNTAWEDGPVVTAMKRGAILLLDEIDLMGPKGMCLQPVLEGNPVLLKRINTIVEPAPGFNVFATANTKGKGDDTGMFIGTNVMNEAMLERFPLAFDQEYPPEPVERKIIHKELCSIGKTEDDEFGNLLVAWARKTRVTADAGEAFITTRRLVHIVKAYGIFNSKDKALKRCLARFEESTGTAFLEAYMMLDKTMKEDMKREAEAKAVEEAKAAGTWVDPDAGLKSGPPPGDIAAEDVDAGAIDMEEF